MLGKHPLSGLEGAGAMLFILRKQFHSLLQTTADIMPKVRSLHHILYIPCTDKISMILPCMHVCNVFVQLPVGSAAQQAALQCYCLQFKPQDHSFLLQSNVFTNISKALSLADESQDSTTPQEKKMRDRVS